MRIKFQKSSDVVHVWWPLSDTDSPDPVFAARSVSLEKYECSCLEIGIIESYI